VPRRITPFLLIAAVAVAFPAAASAQPAASGTATSLRVLSAKANKAGSRVSVKVRWHRGMYAGAGSRKRFALRALAHASNGHKTNLGTVRRRSARAGSETLVVRTTSANAKKLRKARRVTVTATQQYDSPSDADNRYEKNAVGIRAVAGKSRGISIKACSVSAITPGADLSGCDLYGANLANANLAGVNLSGADLEQGSLAGANLATTNLGAANLVGANLAGATWPAGEQSAMTFPEDGPDIVNLIGTAKTSVDVVIYDFGGPNIVGQPSRPGALMKAVQNGVNVRVILNAGQECAGTDPPSQSLCAGQNKLDPLYATEAALQWARRNPRPGKTAGKVRVQFSSQNYQITHQKSVLIDTSNPDGSPRTAGQMTPSSRIMVSTGNLQAYPVDWGQYEKCAKWVKDAQGEWVCQQYEVINADYLSNPAATCKGGSASGCTTEWAARDFAIQVTDPTLMERIAAVFGADQSCQGWNEAPVYRQLLDSTLPDTWANGTLLADGSAYPTMGTTAFYGPNPNPELQAQPQGNSRQRQLALIASAKESLLVYNEEMADPEIANALVAAAANGVDVRVVMASKVTKGVPSQNPYFDYLTGNGVKVNLLDNSATTKGVYYIHAKAIVADGTNAFMGSENFGYASMNFNRELGLMLTNRSGATSDWLPSVQGVAAIMTAFEADWSNPQAISYKPQKAPAQPPLAPLTPGTTYPGAGMLCLEPQPGDLYQPQLPNRTPPPAS
jgi:phosphatidylserine/phosphatidylglycerophosphate/cardiolipin synthase-like enzyme